MTESNRTESTHSDETPLTEAAVAVGSAWARYGLTVGRTALITGARTLEVTAEALGALADGFERKGKDDGEPSSNDAIETRGE